jgi:hypothetical protein
MSWFRLYGLYRRAGNAPAAALHLTVSLLWRNHKTARHRRHIEHRADVERTARQRL